MILLVLRERKGSGRYTCYLRRPQMREKKRDSTSVFFEGCAMLQAQFLFFATHHHGIKNRKIHKENECGNPRPRRDCSANGQHRAPQVERIARVGIRPRDCEYFLFVQIPSRIRADQQSKRTHETTNHDATRRGISKPKNGSSQWITEANAPAHEKFAGNSHRRASTCLRTASKTLVTSSSSKDGSGWSPRL